MNFLKILVVALSAAAALVIEIAFLAYELAHACLDVLVLGKGDREIRRHFK